MKIDVPGQRLRHRPGGVWVFSPDGKHLGTIKPPEDPANCGWGDDGKSLYMTAARVCTASSWRSRARRSVVHERRIQT